MKFLDKLERKIGRAAIPNLTLFIIAAYVIGFVFEIMNPAVMNYMELNPYYICKGQVWRIISWVLVPPSGSNIIFTVIMLMFYYSLGTSLERTWGTFKYNFYIFSGILFTILGAFALYGVFELFVSDMTLLEQFGAEGSQQLLLVVEGLDEEIRVIAYEQLFAGFSTYFINMSIFLAYACTYPDMQVLLYFIIPIKIKWMAYVDVAYLLYMIYQYSRAGVLGWGGIVAIVVSLLNFIVFFLMTRNYRRISPKEIHRKKVYRSQVHQAQQIHTHRCAICGKSEADDPTLEFRFCSKCNGNYEYCQHHLFTHEHVK